MHAHFVIMAHEEKPKSGLCEQYMKHERVSLPKTKEQLEKMHEDDDDVFATSLIDRYIAWPSTLADMCLAMFSVTYDVVSSNCRGKN